MNYEHFLERRKQLADGEGFDPIEIHDFLFPFQKYLVDYACRQGRSAIFADCGLGKTAMQLSWADNVNRNTNKPVLIFTPLAVGRQTVRESEKFGIEARQTRDGSIWSGINVTNYEQLHKFSPDDFAGVVCDESSCLKNFKSARLSDIKEFMRRIPYRLLCTATAAPNDFFELGTSSDVLGGLGFRDMITTFFKQETGKDHLGWGRTKYRFRGHAEQPFWRWVTSWARACQKPSDLGFEDNGYELPALIETETVVENTKARPGMLFPVMAKSLQEQRQERRLSINERIEQAARNVLSAEGVSVVWCQLNDEADLMEKSIPCAEQIKGSMKDEAREEKLEAFTNGEISCLVTKPKIGCWGLNWQHCNNVVMFPGHSFEQYYQAIRRCWRFGQEHPVNLELIVNEGEAGILKNLQRKQRQAGEMFASIVAHMNDSMRLFSTDSFPNQERLPKWVSSTK